MAPMLQPDLPGTKFVFPTAPIVSPGGRGDDTAARGLQRMGAASRGAVRLFALHLLRAPARPTCCPPARPPQRPITLNGGMRMTGWYDIVDLDRVGSEHQDAEAMHESKRCAGPAGEEEAQGRGRRVGGAEASGTAVSIFVECMQRCMNARAEGNRTMYENARKHMIIKQSTHAR